MDRLQRVVDRNHAVAMVKEHGCISYPTEWELVADPVDWDDAYHEDTSFLLGLLAGHVHVPTPSIPIQVETEIDLERGV